MECRPSRLAAVLLLLLPLLLLPLLLLPQLHTITATGFSRDSSTYRRRTDRELCRSATQESLQSSCYAHGSMLFTRASGYSDYDLS